MADSKISDLSAASSLVATDLFVIAQEDTATKKVAFSTLLASLQPVGTRVEVNVFHAESANTNWSTMVVPGSIAGVVGSRESSGAQNAEVTFKVILGAGTWKIHLVSAKFSSAGIITFRVDGGASVGTIDLYNGSLVGNQKSTLAGVVVASSGIHDFNLKMETKNASSSSYFGDIMLITFERTA